MGRQVQAGRGRGEWAGAFTQLRSRIWRGQCYWCGPGLALVLLWASPPTAQAQFTYTATNGMVMITGYTGPGGEVVIPSTIEDLPVTTIGPVAFTGSTSLTQVTIPASVTYIWAGAFANCTSLSAIEVAALNPAYRSVEGILFNKAQTELLAYPAGKAGSYDVPSGIGVMSGYAFAGCTNLASITIPDSVTRIDLGAFYFCVRLTQVTLPHSVRELGDFAFSACTNLATIALSTNLTSIGSSGFSYCTRLAGVTIPNSATNIGNQAFFQCVSLTNATLGNGLLSIQDDAFDWCTSLTEITIPKSTTRVEIAFKFCTSLTNIMVDPLNAVYSSLEGVLFNKSQTTLKECPGGKAGTYTVPDSVRAISDHAFAYCTNFVSVTIPNSVTNLGSYAFYSCNGLTNVMVGSGVVRIGYEAFEHCAAVATILVDPLNAVYSSRDGVLFNKTRTGVLRCPAGKTGSYTIPNGVIAIDQFAFEECAQLSSVTVPSSVTLISVAAFENCTNLTSVYFKGNAPNLSGSSVFWNDERATIYYLAGTTGWGPLFGGRPTQLWEPSIQVNDGNFGVRTNRFGFNLIGPGEFALVVEACTNLAHPVWSPITTNTLTGGPSYFSDPDWTNSPVRFYRLRWR